MIDIQHTVRRGCCMATPLQARSQLQSCQPWHSPALRSPYCWTAARECIGSHPGAGRKQMDRGDGRAAWLLSRRYKAIRRATRRGTARPYGPHTAWQLPVSEYRATESWQNARAQELCSSLIATQQCGKCAGPALPRLVALQIAVECPISSPSTSSAAL